MRVLQAAGTDCHSGAQNASLTSVGIGQLFGSQYNDDKKLLAFSDSVQDASHRAGYFQARTYTFTVRSALVQFIRRQNDDRDLKWLAKAFVEYELNKLDATRFVGTFIAPNLCWRSEYERFVEDKSAPVDSRLLKWVRKRLEWDALHNLGLHAEGAEPWKTRAPLPRRPDTSSSMANWTRWSTGSAKK